MRTEGGRSDRSPSLDKIEPALGYVPDNVRVISDRANRLKSALDRSGVAQKADSGPSGLRADYQLVLNYLDREALLKSVRCRRAAMGPQSSDWTRIEEFLNVHFREGDRVFRSGVDAAVTAHAISAKR